MRKEKGAEAKVEITDKSVKKSRRKKNYRHPELDKKIRVERTETEKKLIAEALNHGVEVPEAKKISDSEIKLQKIDGEKLRGRIDAETGLLGKLGENIALLHSIDIIHGDLTTSNVMVKNDELFLIDFGLSYRSKRTEDRAVDIHLLKQVLESSHPEAAEKAWQNFLKGYREYKDSDKVLEQLEEVEQRGRYK